MRIAFLGNFNVEYSSENHHKKSLEELGHDIMALQEGKAPGEEVLAAARQSDLLVVVHTHGWQTPGKPLGEVLVELKKLGVPSLTYHLDLWLGLGRQKDLETDDFYKEIDHFFTVDRLMADWFNNNTRVKGHYLTAGVFGPECYMAKPAEKKFDVIFVGSKGYHKEWPYRPQLVDWLAKTYGGRFSHFGGDGLGTIRGKSLNQLYADSLVVVGDSLCLGSDYPDYWSDRVYETLGRGGFLIHPYIKGLERQFEDKKHLVLYKYGDFKQLKGLIDFYIENDKPREITRQRGHKLVKKHHTYLNRWRYILSEVCK